MAPPPRGARSTGKIGGVIAQDAGRSHELDPAGAVEVPFARDVQQWAVYSAESSVAPGRQLRDLDEAQTVVDAILASPEWGAWFPHMAGVDVKESTLRSEDGFIVSYAAPDADLLATRATIYLHREMLHEVVLVHELAHCVAPRWGAAPGALPPRSIHSLRAADLFTIHDHGRYFRGGLTLLLTAFGDGDTHDELRDAYEHYGVPAAETDEVLEAVAVSRQVEGVWLAIKADDEARADEIEAEDAEFRRRMVERGVHPPLRPEGWIPPESWAEFLYWSRLRLQRTQGRAVWSQDRVAEIVSRAEPCRRRDVSVVEQLASRPDDPRLLRLAMCMAVIYGLDPIYLRWMKRLTRWDCDLLMRELLQLNPSWVRLVRRLNRMLRERPPLWAVEGDR